MGRILSRVTGMGVPARLAPWVAGIAAIALLWALWGAWQAFEWFNDREAIEDATNASNAEFREKQLEVEREVGRDKAARDSANDDHDREMEGTIDDARANGSTAADDLWNGGLWADPED